MVFIEKFFYRTYQAVMRIGTCFMDFTPPELIEGPGSIAKLPALIKSKGVRKVLVVADRQLVRLGLPGALLDGLAAEHIAYELFDGVEVNPTIQNIEAALDVYTRSRCEAFVAFGGGSPMDCAKAAGARASNPRKSVHELRGLLKVTRRPPLLFAVPTTAGTGSETTVAAIVADPETREKFSITDPKLIPRYAVLDPCLTLGLPPEITAATGMDALTHAVEAYIGRSNTRGTKAAAEKAVQLVFENLERAYADGGNLEARSRMLMAAHYGGIAFTRAYVGYVHAIAHNLGGLYGIAHGLANAVVLPYVLEWFGASIHGKLARLADVAGISAGFGADEARKAALFIEAVRGLNRRMGIPEKIPQIQADDIPLMVRRSLKEAHPLYPVPRFMSGRDCEGVIRRLMP
jgi:alcohol dehydrogenase class IV